MTRSFRVKAQVKVENWLRRALVLSLLLVNLLIVPSAFQNAEGSNRTADFEQLYQEGREGIRTGQFTRVIAIGQQYLSLASEAGDVYGQGRANSLLGNALFYQDRHREALLKFQESRRLMREAADRAGEAIALKDIGITCKLLGKYDEGLEALHESLQMFRDLNMKDEEGSALDNLGTGYAGLGATNLAFEFYSEAIQIGEEINSPDLIFHGLTRIGSLYCNRRMYSRGLEYLRRAEAMSEAAKISPSTRIWLLQVLSGTLLSTGQIGEALDVAHRSLAISKRIGWKAGMALDYQGLGRIHLKDDPEGAIEYFKRSLALFEEARTGMLWGAHSSLGRAYKSNGDPDLAIVHFEKTIESLEYFRDQLASEQHRASFLGNRRAVYHELIETLVHRNKKDAETNDHERAFSIFERGKARALWDAIVEARVHKGETAPDARFRDLSAQIADLQKQLVSEMLSSDERERILRQIRSAELELDQLQTASRRRGRAGAESHDRDAPMNVARAQSLLDPGTALLAYSVGEGSVIVFLVTRDNYQVSQLPIIPDLLNERVQSYLDLLSSGESNVWREPARRLFADLIGPIEAHLSGNLDQLVIVTDGVLQSLPFETLLKPAQDRDGSDECLLEEYSISYAPSAAVLGELMSAKIVKSAPEATLLLLADPLFPRRSETNPGGVRALYEEEGLNVGPIPFSATEARELQRFAGAGSKILVQSDATEKQFKSEDLEKFQILHLSTHGLISQQNPQRSALMLSYEEGDGEDGFLQAREIYSLKLASDLVVLSACQTARGPVIEGEGVQGLAQAFLYAGAQSVVASLWNVNDERTAALMARFYEKLGEGLSKADALREAKLEMCRANPVSSPRHWAPFVLIGERDSVIRIEKRSSLSAAWISVLSGIGLLAIVLGIFLILKRRSYSVGVPGGT